MVVQVIKQGKSPEERNPKMVATCAACACEFSFQAQDAAYVSDQRDGDYYQLPCPNATCSKPVTKQVPRPIVPGYIPGLD